MPAATAASDDTTMTSPRRLLIVDDDLAICALLSDIASAIGYSVESASTPEAINRLVGHGHDLVMLDLSLGETDGMLVMRTLADRQPGANIVLLSGADVSVLSGARRVAEMSGFNVVGACGKPASIVEIEAVLRNPVVAPEGDDESTSGDIEHQVLDALDRGDLHLVYQPIVKLATNEITSAEALVRMGGKGFEQFTPEVFVPIIERAGRSADLLRIVFRNAARDRSAVKAIASLENVSLNISVLDLTDLALPEAATEILSVAAPPNRWTLEVTETAELKEVAHALDVLVRMRLKGFSLAMDDFGSGSSTLDRLRELPFTSVKADRRFMQTDFDDVEHALGMLKAAVELGGALGLRVVAEGIESREEFDAARQVGCDYAQGYFIGRPVRAESFGVLVVAWEVANGQD